GDRYGDSTTRKARRGDCPCFFAAYLLLDCRLLHSSHGRGLGEPRALSWRSLWTSGGKSKRSARSLRTHTRRGFRSGGETPHYSRHLCFELRLLRRLLFTRSKSA